MFRVVLLTESETLSLALHFFSPKHNINLSLFIGTTDENEVAVIAKDLRKRVT